MTQRTSRASNQTDSEPSLLVSVRSNTEAEAALAGGCNILDVKNPSRGSLGMADVEVIEQVLQTGNLAGVPVSTAMGEVSDYPGSLARNGSDGQLPESLSELTYTKIGLSNLNHDRNWSARWQDTVSFLTDNLSKQPAGTHQNHVAVIYADWQQAKAPSPDDIVDCVLSSGFSSDCRIAGVLVDTWSKHSGRLLDSLTVEQLQNLAVNVQQSDRFFAIAGRLTSTMLPDLTPVGPDVIAVRSAVCRNEDRTSSVDADAVKAFRAEIDRSFATVPTASAVPIGVTHEQL